MCPEGATRKLSSRTSITSCGAQGFHWKHRPGTCLREYCQTTLARHRRPRERKGASSASSQSGNFFFSSHNFVWIEKDQEEEQEGPHQKDRERNSQGSSSKYVQIKCSECVDRWHADEKFRNIMRPPTLTGVNSTSHLARVSHANTFSRGAHASQLALSCVISHTCHPQRHISCRTRNVHGLTAFLFHLRRALHPCCIL